MLEEAGNMHEVQHIFRKYSTSEFAAVEAGTKAFDVCLDSPDLNLEVGDLVTFQEMNEEGELTGRELTKKVSYKMSTRDKEGNSGVPSGADKAGLAVLGFVPPEAQTLRSIYHYGYTMDLVLDKDSDDSEYFVSDGPYYAPAIAAPDLQRGGILEHLHIDRWPAGRYSVTLMVRVEDDEEDGPVQMYVADALIMVVVKDNTEDKRYGGFLFEELDTRPLQDGKLINIDGKWVTPMPVADVTEIIDEQLAQQEQQDPEEVKRLMEEFDKQVEQFTSVPGNAAISMHNNEEEEEEK